MGVSFTAKSYTRKYVANQSIVDSGDDVRCVLCDRDAKTFVYYPPLADSHFAPPEVERVCMKLCKSHYDQAKAMINKSVRPVSMENLISMFLNRINKHKFLKGWRMTTDNSTKIWFDTQTAAIEDYKLFESWVNEVRVNYLSDEDRFMKFNIFLKNNPELAAYSIKTFNAYLFPKPKLESKVTIPTW